MHLKRNGFIEKTASELAVLNEYSRDTEEGPKSVNPRRAFLFRRRNIQYGMWHHPWQAEGDEADSAP